MPAVPEKGLHANRSDSVPTDGHGPHNCFSRTDILTGKTPTAFGSGQSMGIVPDGESKTDNATWPKKWHKEGRVLRVPKCVILSSFPFWTLYWPMSYFYLPRDVVGDSGFGFLNNYYYLEQWNGIDMSAGDDAPDYSFIQGYDVSDPSVSNALFASSGYVNNRVWRDMRYLAEGDKSTIYNAQAACQMTCQDEGCAVCTTIPTALFNNCPTPPQSERFFTGVGTVQNPYYLIHPQLLDAFLAAKEILENDKDDPVYVIIPNWIPRKLHQLRNASLTQTHEKLNPAHGGSDNRKACEVSDTIPCHTTVQVCWAPPFPDKDDPRNNPGFDQPQVPWLSSLDPGFGTNTLHLYIGHPNMMYFPSGNFYDMQAWPLSPEEQWIAGPVGQTSYLGDPRPFFAGRRPVWRAFGYDYGYTSFEGATLAEQAGNLYDNVYGTIVAGAADAYKDNFYKFRNIGTRIFTFDVQWDFQWDFTALGNDRRNDCPATQFYTGFSFADFANSYNDDDHNITDCSSFTGDGGVHLAYGETHNFFPTRAEMDQAVGVGVQLAKRVMGYYNSNDEGSEDFFKLALDRNGLGDFNCSYEGKMPGAFLDADGIVAYVREYFKDHV